MSFSKKSKFGRAKPLANKQGVCKRKKGQVLLVRIGLFVYSFLLDSTHTMTGHYNAKSKKKKKGLTFGVPWGPQKIIVYTF